MPDVLVIGDTFRCPEIRHEVPLGIPDPFVYLERDGRRHVFVPSMEQPRIEAVGLALEVHAYEEVGVDELVAQGVGWHELRLELAARICRAAGLRDAVVPHTFPAGHLERLRAEGVGLSVDQALFDDRRRVKSGHELAGIRRAQQAAEAGMEAGLALLRRADNHEGALVLDGEPLTVERVKAAVGRAFEVHGCTADEFVVAHGAQAALGHDMGSGPISAGETVVFDLWPRDRESACFADMTRTFVVGGADDEVRAWHATASEALETATALVRPGAECRAVFDAVCDVVERAGYPTQRTKRVGEVLRDGFFHGLGHGVGLEAHEEPFLGVLPGGELVAGDVVTLEPGVYRAGVGGVRLEDLVLVTEDGCEVLTSFPYDVEV
jgi:Xaa-Pro aminopeptidase